MPPVPVPLDGSPQKERTREVMHNGWRMFSKVEWLFAKQMPEPFEVIVGDVACKGEKNDWLVMDNTGALKVVESKKFMEDYKP